MRQITNVQNICKFVTLHLYNLISNMKNFLFLFSFLLLTNCSDTRFVNDCFLGFEFNATLNINLPEFSLNGNNLNVPGGKAITRLQTRTILVINTATSGYKVFDLQCPEMDCDSNMTFEDELHIVCPCSGKKYNSLNGSPIDGEGCFVLEYNVLQTSSSTLQISY